MRRHGRGGPKPWLPPLATDEDVLQDPWGLGRNGLDIEEGSVAWLVATRAGVSGLGSPRSVPHPNSRPVPRQLVLYPGTQEQYIEEYYWRGMSYRRLAVHRSTATATAAAAAAAAATAAAAAAAAAAASTAAAAAAAAAT